MTRLMKSNRFVRAMALVAALGALTAHEVGEAAEASATYSYDEIGRLRSATTVGNDTRTVTYTYDAAGNRTNVSAGVSPTLPASITVPASSMTGSYSVSWGASSGTLTAYQLFEATNAGFTGETLVYSGTSTSALISGRGNGTYYYRVRACDGTFCSGYRAGGNPTSVTLPPSTPPSISVPSTSSTGSYSISWSAVGETVTAYELYEATNSSFSGEVQVYSGTATSQALSGRGNGTYYYRVRACNGAACSGYRAGGNSTVVTLPSGIPASISVPSSSNTGAYTVSWGTSTGTVTAYELYEATNSSFTGQTLVYNNTGTSIGLSGRGNGTYYYRVRACNGASCSDYRPGANATTVTLPPGVPTSISVPAGSITGSYTISWGASSGTLTAYELYEATNASFSGQTLVYSGTSTSTSISGRGDGTYYYQVRACNAGQCSGYRTGGNSTVVTIPPGMPAFISVPSFGSTVSYAVGWGVSSGTVTAFELYEATNASFSGEILAYSGTNPSVSFNGHSSGTYYYRVRACNTSAACSSHRVGSNGVVVTPPIVALNPSISVFHTGFVTNIGTLANLNGNPATIHSFSLSSCSLANSAIQGGAQSVSWVNDNYYYHECAFGSDIQCSANYVIRNSNTAQLTPGTASVTIVAQPIDLPPGQSCN